jgi:DNA polymerase-3 subunit alpha
VTEAEYLATQVACGLAVRYPAGIPAPAQARADYERSVITQMGYDAYFLVVADIVRHANEQGIRVGPGRGSGAGSQVAYALNITQLDPLKHGLIFERFLNPERPSMPDIDLDFDKRRRGEMIRYVTEKYGEDHVAQIVTFGTIETRTAIQDAAKVLFDKAGYGLADRIIKALPPPVMAADIPLAGIFDAKHPRYAEAAEVRALIESDPQIAEIMEVARGLEGLKRQWGVHASGVVICAEPLIDHIPIMRRDSDGAIITQLDMNACEALGLVKMDFLGLRNLTVMDDCLRDIATTGQQPPDLATLTFDDPATFDLLARGDTLGVFQLDGVAMRDLLRRMQPQCLADIAAAAALYRPGPMGANAHNDYVDRKAGRQEVTPIHPELAEPLADILDETYSLLVFQEQVLAIVQRVAGYSLGRADVLRRAMGKKKRDVLDREYEPFAAGMTKNGYSPGAIETLWNILIPFSDYAFVKSHATGYAVLAYQNAFLKTHYPAQYMAALLTGAADNKDRMGIYLAECRRLGIKVTVPDVNESQGPFTATNGAIRFGLAAVRDVGDKVVEAIVEGRAAGRYENFGDFLRRVDATKLNSKALTALIRAGAFDSLGHPRWGLEVICGDALSAAVKVRRAEDAGLFSLFDSDDAPDEMDLPIPDREWTTAERLELEREMLGLYVSSHPLDGLEHILAAGTPIASILDGTVPVDTEVTLVGLLASVTRKTSKKTGKPWAVAQLEDQAVGIELCCFARAFEELGPLLKRDAVVTVTGRVSQRDRDGDRLSVIVDRITIPDLTAPVTVSLPLERCTRELVCGLREILERHPGDRAIRVRLLVGPKRVRTWEGEGGIRVTPGAELVGELTGLLGDGCLAGVARRQ